MFNIPSKLTRLSVSVIMSPLEDLSLIPSLMYSSIKAEHSEVLVNVVDTMISQLHPYGYLSNELKLDTYVFSPRELQERLADILMTGNSIGWHSIKHIAMGAIVKNAALDNPERGLILNEAKKDLALSLMQKISVQYFTHRPYKNRTIAELDVYLLGIGELEWLEREVQMQSYYQRPC